MAHLPSGKWAILFGLTEIFILPLFSTKPPIYFILNLQNCLFLCAFYWL